MDQILLDKQPGLATSAIVGTLTLAKTGTTARTATFPDAAIVVSGSASALTSGRVPYVTTGGLLLDDASMVFSASGGGGLTLSNASSSFYHTISRAAGFAGGIVWSTAGSARWIAQADNATESGSNAGSAWALLARTDAGAAIDTPLSIVRASGGAITLARPVTCTGTVTVPNGTAAAPGIRLTSEASGLYRVSATSLGLAVAGTAAASLTSAGLFTASAITANGIVSSQGLQNTVGDFTSRADEDAQTILGRIRCGFFTGLGDNASFAHYDFGTSTSYALRQDAAGATSLNSASGQNATIRVNNSIVLTVGASASSFASGTTLGILNTGAASLALSGGMTFASIAAATTDGGLQRESNQEKLYAYANGIGGWLDKCLFSQYATVTQSGIVTAQSLASATARGTRTLPANFFKLGKVLKFRLCGRYTTDAAAGNATVSILLGGTTFRTTGSFAMDASSTNQPWEIEGEIVCQSTGATGTVEGVAWWAHGITGATGNFNIEPMAGTGAVTVDTTASAAFDVQWTATDAGTAISCTCFRLWEVC